MDNTIGTIPEFTSDETVQPAAKPAEAPIPEEVKQDEEGDQIIVPAKEKDTPAPPAEKPDEQVVVESPAPQDETAKAIEGLQKQRVELLKEISELRGTKREIKQDQLDVVQAQIDELKDLNPADVAMIEKVLRGKGYVPKQEVQKMFYDAVKTEKTNEFLEKYPEYKPENDPGDVNWTMLQREIAYYKPPADPHQIIDILERAHRSIVKVPSGVSQAPQKRQVQIASVGGGGTQRPSSPSVKLDPEKRSMLKGFTPEEIQEMESKLN